MSGSGADASDSQVNPSLSKSGDAEEDEKRRRRNWPKAPPFVTCQWAVTPTLLVTLSLQDTDISAPNPSRAPSLPTPIARARSAFDLRGARQACRSSSPHELMRLALHSLGHGRRVLYYLSHG